MQKTTWFTLGTIALTIGIFGIILYALEFFIGWNLIPVWVLILILILIIVGLIIRNRSKAIFDPTNLTIVGLKEEEYPILFATIQKLMRLYEITKIRVIIRPKWKNAGAISLFGYKLVIGKPLIGELSSEEMEGIISHEFSHLNNNDSLSIAFLGLLFIAPLIYTSITFQPMSILTVFAFFISFFIAIYGFKIRNWVMLNLEIRADIEAVVKTKNPKALEKALIKLIMGPLIKNEKPGIFRILFNCGVWLIAYFFGFTHPGLMERVEHLEFTEKILEFHK